jgi:hypothetical protein
MYRHEEVQVRDVAMKDDRGAEMESWNTMKATCETRLHARGQAIYVIKQRIDYSS